jgi:[acyl-carrier-protein] S-malonyltransferase
VPESQSTGPIEKSQRTIKRMKEYLGIRRSRGGPGAPDTDRTSYLLSSENKELLSALTEKDRCVVAFPAAMNINGGFSEDARFQIEKYSKALDLYSRAAEKTGYPVKDLCLTDLAAHEGDTIVKNLAIFVYEIAMYKALEEELGRPIEPKYFSGYSIGVYAALVITGAVSYEDALYVIAEGSRTLQALADKREMWGIVINGGDYEIIKDYVDATSRLSLSINTSPGFTALAIPRGDRQTEEDLRSDIDKIIEDLKRLYGAEGKPANIKCLGRFTANPHHEFYPEAEALGLELSKTIYLSDPNIPILSSSISGAVLRTADDVRQEVEHGTSSPIFWTEMLDAHVSKTEMPFITIGPAQTLIKSNRQIAPKMVSVSLKSMEGLQELASNIDREARRVRAASADPQPDERTTYDGGADGLLQEKVARLTQRLMDGVAKVEGLALGSDDSVLRAYLDGLRSAVARLKNRNFKP